MPAARSQARPPGRVRRPRHEGVEVVQRAELRVDCVVPAVSRADGPGRARVAGACVQRVVGALPRRRADRVDWREVDHVEAHGRDRFQAAGRGAQRSRSGPAVRAGHGAFGAREELVPGTVERALPVHHDGTPAGPGQQVAQRAGGEDRGDLPGDGRSEPGGGRDAAVAKQRGHRCEHGPRLPGRGAPSPGRAAAGSGSPGGLVFRAARSNSSAPAASMSSASRPSGTLMAASWRQRAERVPPCLHPEMPQPRRGDRDLGAIAVGALG